MCDLCAIPIGDHDKAYEFDHPEHLRLRFSKRELIQLCRLRRSVKRLEGPAAGDTQRDPEDVHATG